MCTCAGYFWQQLLTQPQLVLTCTPHTALAVAVNCCCQLLAERQLVLTSCHRYTGQKCCSQQLKLLVCRQQMMLTRVSQTTPAVLTPRLRICRDLASSLAAFWSIANTLPCWGHIARQCNNTDGKTATAGQQDAACERMQIGKRTTQSTQPAGRSAI